MTHFRSRMWIVVLTFAIANVEAHDKSTLKKSAELDKQVAKTSASLDKYTTQMEKTGRALSSVGQAKSKELNKKFNVFAKQVAALEGNQKHAVSAIHEMNSKAANAAIPGTSRSTRFKIRG